MMENEFVHLLLAHGHYVLVGTVALVGAVMLILKKLGFLVFDRDKITDRQRDARSDICKHCSLVETDGKKKNEWQRIIKCDNHDSLCDTVTAIRQTQIRMETQQKTNFAKLSNGKKEFGELHSQINELRIGVAVLLDRSGGIPKEFTEYRKKRVRDVLDSMINKDEEDE